MLKRMVKSGYLKGGFNVGSSRRWMYRDVKIAAMGSLNHDGKGMGHPVMIRDKLLLSLDELAGYLNCSRKHILAAVVDREMPQPVEFGGKRFWRSWEIVNWIDGRHDHGSPELRYAISEARASTKEPSAVPACIQKLEGYLIEYIPNKQHCVYFLVKGDEVVYIGSSFTIYSRITQHKEKDFDRVLYFHVEPERMLAVEAELIRVIKPKLNVKGLSEFKLVGTDQEMVG
jgi:predicted DNA-binding transcriptional regulator AlpA